MGASVAVHALCLCTAQHIRRVLCDHNRAATPHPKVPVPQNRTWKKFRICELRKDPETSRQFDGDGMSIMMIFLWIYKR